MAPPLTAVSRVAPRSPATAVITVRAPATALLAMSWTFSYARSCCLVSSSICFTWAATRFVRDSMRLSSTCVCPSYSLTRSWRPRSCSACRRRVASDTARSTAASSSAGNAATRACSSARVRSRSATLSSRAAKIALARRDLLADRTRPGAPVASRSARRADPVARPACAPAPASSRTRIRRARACASARIARLLPARPLSERRSRRRALDDALPSRPRTSRAPPSGPREARRGRSRQSQRRRSGLRSCRLFSISSQSAR